MAVTSPYGGTTGGAAGGTTGSRNGTPMTLAGPSAPPPASGERLPRPPRRRRPGFAALAVLLIVGSAAAAGLLAIRLDDRTPVLVARDPITVGQQITADDLATVKVSADGLSFIPETAASTVIGQYAVQSVPAGRPLDAAMFGGSGLLREGYVAIGVPLKPGSYPASGLQSGDVVDVIRATSEGEGTTLAQKATVSAVVSSSTSGGGFGGSGGTVATGDLVITLIVRESRSGANANGNALSARITAAAMAGQIGVTLIQRGATLERG